MSEYAAIPAITGEQMAMVDRIMIDELGVDVLQLMEVAGLAVAAFARDRMLRGDAAGKRIAVLCGTGGNGGDGLVAARFLHCWGAEVAVWLSRRPGPGRGVAAHQLAIAERMGIPVTFAWDEVALAEVDLVIDGLLGFSLSGAPSGTTAALIRAVNAQSAPVLAIDLPSGLTATEGEVLEPCVRAASTITLALPKTGLLTPAARTVTGPVWCADIGVPAAVYLRFGIRMSPIFRRGGVIPVVA
jgi:NAD(P)H-hydrate epimerase